MRERYPDSGQEGWESPRGEEAQESRWPRPELIIRGASRGARLFQGDQDAEAPMRGPGGFCRKAQERREEVETLFRPLVRRKALKGKA